MGGDEESISTQADDAETLKLQSELAAMLQYEEDQAKLSNSSTEKQSKEEAQLNRELASLNEEVHINIIHIW